MYQIPQEILDYLDKNNNHTLVVLLERYGAAIYDRDCAIMITDSCNEDAVAEVYEATKILLDNGIDVGDIQEINETIADCYSEVEESKKFYIISNYFENN